MTEIAAITGTNNGVEFAERIENIKILVAEDMPLNSSNKIIKYLKKTN